MGNRFGPRLRAWLELKELRTSEFCGKIGVHPNYLGAVLAGRVRMSAVVESKIRAGVGNDAVWGWLCGHADPHASALEGT